MSQTREYGAAFFVAPQSAEHVFTPEDFTDEHKMIAKTASDFVLGDITPVSEQLEHQDWDLTVKLLHKAGDLGLLAVDVPEAYDGLGLDKVTSSLITEYMTRGGSFALSYGAHVGIGSLPIVYFGNEEQKKKYLPDLASGRKFAAYALTEPGSGSDALGARTVAKLSADGKYYILNGTKQYITNSAFADVFVVYAKIDGEHFSAFIVERNFQGVSTGPEEKKMGIKASSTRPLILEDVHVPVENLLGEAGKGHVIAFNILNIGRYKLAVGCVGGIKVAMETAVKYANTREQFKRPIASFPLIQGKIADMAMRAFVTESIAYRTTGAIDAALSEVDLTGPDSGRIAAKAIEEFAIECSINKVFASESLDFTVDEGVQIHGGAGFIQDYPIERMYRDSRINRIFEGTNEINRMIIPGTLMKKALKGEVELLQAAKGLQEELMGMIEPADESVPLAVERHAVEMTRKIFLFVGGLAVQKYGKKLEVEQEILANLADISIALYAMETAVLRADKTAASKKTASADIQADYVRLFVAETFPEVERIAKDTLAAMQESDELKTSLSVFRKLTRMTPTNTVELKRRIAARIIESEQYLA
ncbi:MAG: acyl-CoA dehydrogenase family protein [Acidibacillus sp.]|uniref:Acyl-CoA dehydrogenase n=1 Tax=Sulfoacidibacillus ferrooxidans TaxID=2005001 RepID=A0A9X1V7G2_9BACL|nr:acyl-CoA dehydrogenase family protein [Sulfoacidibacillus ferrooxidans]MCI0182946.1 putative acyl-CoA dehydrogenase [Sulfoacidibacillus ferrooxidans]MCY0893481.1 acyl-CoA dehydrogenase family protein [Acidibacillus sp.]